LASRVDLFVAIRYDHDSGMSVRALARKYGVHRRTVHQALASPLPPERKVPQRSAPVLGLWKTQIDAWLVEDLLAPRKQRHTASRIHERLIAELGAQVSYTSVQRYVKQRRPQVRAAVGSGPAEGFVPQVREPAEQAEVDFGEVAFVLRGKEVTARMFVLRLSYSGFAVHRGIPCRESRCVAGRACGGFRSSWWGAGRADPL